MENLKACFAKSGDMVTRTIAGETIIVPVRDQVGDLDCIRNLNEVGTRIWELLDGRTSVERIVEVIQDEYEVEAEEASRDTLEFLGMLESAAMIQPAARGETR